VQLTAVSASDTTGGVNFRSALGVNFNTDPSFDKQYISFSDVNGNDSYQPGTDIDFGQRGVIDERFYISLIEIDGSSETDASVVFERPNFDAEFSQVGSEMIVHIRRVGSNPATDMGPGDLRRIEITSTGQIGVI
jgi:hypothetical protein